MQQPRMKTLPWQQLPVPTLWRYNSLYQHCHGDNSIYQQCDYNNSLYQYCDNNYISQYKHFNNNNYLYQQCEGGNYSLYSQQHWLHMILHFTAFCQCMCRFRGLEVDSGFDWGPACPCCCWSHCRLHRLLSQKESWWRTWWWWCVDSLSNSDSGDDV